MVTKLKILLATDYSESVTNAEQYAVQFAQKTRSSITFVHVYDIPFNFPTEHSEYIKAADQLRKHELQKLEQHCNKLFNRLNVKQGEIEFECVVLEGTVGKQIIREAEQSHMDIIITGTHGASGFRKYFLGSHTWDVIKKSKVPVLAIPVDAMFNEIKNIVFATEYRQGEISGILFLVELAKQLNAEVTILHISNYALSKEFEIRMFERFKNEIQLDNQYAKLTLRLVHYDDIVEGLDQFCINEKTDWLAMSPEKPLFLEQLFIPSKSITKAMSFHTHIPLLAIPDFYQLKREEFCEQIKNAN